MPSLDPVRRSQDARLAAYAMHARHSAVDTTRNARAAFLARFEREVDPEMLLSDADRKARAEAAKRRYFTDLSRKSAKVRRKR